ncbi:hypothetical protein TWF594_001977 [Orbilia oligospora]|nr:hypothetical protein TWF594_001977 [Orbilia oligospora]
MVDGISEQKSSEGSMMGNLRRLFLSGDNRQEYEMKFTGIQRCCSEPSRRKGAAFVSTREIDLHPRNKRARETGIEGDGMHGFVPARSGQSVRPQRSLASKPVLIDPKRAWLRWLKNEATTLRRSDCSNSLASQW